ncbi:MAG: VanZ family protein [Oscillospiraceae bacterium]
MMVNVLGSIRLAVCAFPLLAAPVAVPFFCRQMRAHCFNWVRTVFGGLFLFYVLCVLALVFFPLPDAAQAAKLTTYDAQLVPFQFVADFLRETPLVCSDARTYLPALLDRTVQQVVLNILMLMPFGMYLRYVCGLDLGTRCARVAGVFGVHRARAAHGAVFPCSAARTACVMWTI